MNGINNIIEPETIEILETINKEIEKIIGEYESPEYHIFCAFAILHDIGDSRNEHQQTLYETLKLLTTKHYRKLNN